MGKVYVNNKLEISRGKKSYDIEYLQELGYLERLPVFPIIYPYLGIVSWSTEVDFSIKSTLCVPTHLIMVDGQR